ncbi:MAG: GNAT family N-acetyltransferase [Acidobacteriota bacterium]|nr:GNAT family N-acetyltransferase [Acidobacteriota bacterium]
MNYRLFTADDFDALYAIEEICFQPPLRFERPYMAELIRAKNSATWIAEADRVMVGFAIVDWRTTSRGILAYVPTIEVLPAYRGLGVGRELLRLLEQSAQEAGAFAIGLHVDVQNTEAIRLYESQAYVRLGMDRDFYGQGRAAYMYKKEFPKVE